MRNSIRRRLIASYALLTLLTVGVMGGLSLALLQRYLDRREGEFLTANAEAVARQASPLVWPVPRAAELRDLARTSAFLIDARVRLLDAEAGVLADSGPTVEADELLWIAAPVDPVADADVAVDARQKSVAPPADRLQGSAGEAPLVFAFVDAHRKDVAPGDVPQTFTLRLGDPSPALSHQDAKVTVVRRFAGPWGTRVEFEGAFPAVGAHPATLPAPDSAPIGEVVAFPPLAGGIHTVPARSDRWVRVSIGPPIGPGVPLAWAGAQVPFGYVEVSQGPNFAAEALGTTAQAFGLAAIGATVLAALVGLVISRGLVAPLQSLTTVAARMGGGDLTARAAVRGGDEIARLAAQFNRMAERLEASFVSLAAERDALRRFIADASHELRTPITALTNFNTLLQTTAADDAAARAEFLAESEVQLRRLGWITHNLLDLSRLDAGIAPLNLASCDAGDLLDGAAAPYQTLARERGVKLVVDRPEPPLAVTCDPGRVALALSNLLDNALKFTGRGGHVTIGASPVAPGDGVPNGSVAGDEALGRGGAAASGVTAGVPAVTLWVRDDGPGIAPEDVPHLFERFYRGRHAPSGEEVDGVGLGLAIVESVARVHGGTVAVESAAMEGSCFSLTLPAAPT